MSSGEMETKRIQAIELLAIGGKTQVEIAEIIGTTPQTISGWKRSKEFMELVVKRSRELLKENLPDVYKSLTDKSKQGNDRHIKIYLDHIEKLEEVKSKETKITFTWQPPKKENTDES